ncbi:RpiB/LacA/LacB family sugar-phosphate isomerase [Candidatus Parcubacteria bacterium]|nr:MAG: RpiB/LacA/LacB family sugar-phosphate isomerase [Candidatus Parcubacteria bacterium]
MVIYFGADHRGYDLKEFLKEFVEEQAYEVYDVGNTVYDENDDYPDFAADLARRIKMDPDNSKGILVCGSGVGMCVVANRFPGVRAGIGISPDQVYDARKHDSINVLCLAADFVTKPIAQKMVQTFLSTPFDGEEKHARRLEKISELENFTNA